MIFKHRVSLMLLLVLISVHLSCTQEKKFFRNDYQYITKTDAFYKTHTLPKTWEGARRKCETEGATLFYPEDDEEAEAVMDYWKRTQPFKNIFIGVYTPHVEEVYETLDGIPLAEVYNKWRPGEPNNQRGQEHCVEMYRDGKLNDVQCNKTFPFICKKTHDSLKWNKECDLPDMGTPLRNSGYFRWGFGQPDGGESASCGAMFYNGQINDVSCAQKLFFICEHEIDVLKNDYALRFSQVFTTVKP